MKTFHLQIVTPDGIFFDDQAVRVKVRGALGDLAILAGHSDFVTALGIGQADVYLENGTVRSAACSGGMINVSGEQTRVIATTFEWQESIDLDRALKAKEKAQAIISNSKDGLALDIGKAKLARALARIDVAEK